MNGITGRLNMNVKAAYLVQSLEIKLKTGEPMKILVRDDLIMAFTIVFNMQWRLNFTGVLIQKGTNGGSLKFMSTDGITYQNFFIDSVSVDNAISFFKSWGFQNFDA